MLRLFELIRTTSSAASVALLVVMNLIPLAGVLWWGWNVYSLLVLYWIENGIIGVINVPKILRAEGEVLATGPQLRVNGALARSRGAIVAFFVMHYGIFWIGHGIFVFLFPLFVGMGSMFGSFGPGFEPSFGPDGTPVIPSLVPPAADPGLRFDVIALGAVALAISHGASYVLNYIGRGEYRTASPLGQTFAPYPRLVALHLTILFGAFASIALGSPVGAVAVLVAIKIIVDLALHLAERRRAAGRVTATAA